MVPVPRDGPLLSGVPTGLHHDEARADRALRGLFVEGV